MNESRWGLSGKRKTSKERVQRVDVVKIYDIVDNVFIHHPLLWVMNTYQ